MADSDVPPTSHSPDSTSPATKRRARAAASSVEPRPERAAPAAPAVDTPSPSVSEPRRTEETDDETGTGHAVDYDPRQGTLMGFELPEDALASLRAQAVRGAASAPPAGEARVLGLVRPSEEPMSQVRAGETVSAPARVNARSHAVAGGRTSSEPMPPRTPRVGTAKPADEGPPAEPDPADRARGASNPVPPFSPWPTSGKARSDRGRDRHAPPPLAQPPLGELPPLPVRDPALAATVAALSRTLTDECIRAEHERRRTVRWLILTVAMSCLLLAASVAQMVVLSRAARDSADALQRTEALLRSQQSALAVVVDAASAAAADIHGTATALTAKLATRAAHTPASPYVRQSEPAAVRRHKRSPRVRRHGRNSRKRRATT